MTIDILEQVYPQTGSRLLRTILQIIDADLGPEQRREFIGVLATIESVVKDGTAKLSSEQDVPKLLNDLRGFEESARDYFREICRRITERNSSKEQ